MQYFYQNNHSQDMIVFFAGWGCDNNQFVNLHDRKNLLIVYDYQDLNLDFDFAKYDNIYVMAYSAGVFIASVVADKIPNVRKKVAICGNPYMFDQTWGIPAELIRISNELGPDNYMDFRRKYMVFSEEEFIKYNQLESLRTFESCKNELTALHSLYTEYKDKINPVFDKAVMAENDLIFKLEVQKDFYKDKLQVVKNARHHIFFRFNSFEDILDFKQAK